MTYTREQLESLKLKELISTFTSSTGQEYAFNKKPEMIDAILAACASNEVAASSGAGQADPDGEQADSQPSSADTVEKAPAKATSKKKAPAKASSKKTVKVKSPNGGRAKRRAEPSPKATPETMESILKKADVKAVLNLKTKAGADETTSEKIRRLHFRCGLTIGQTAKALGIHYSFAFCVIDARKKSLGVSSPR